MTSVAESQGYISVNEYLESELVSDVRREYLAGFVYPRADSNVIHNTIVTNLLSALHEATRQGPLQVFAVDMKLRLKAADGTLFYYPDIMVCHWTGGTNAHFLESPVIVMEVSSPETRRVDRGEKFLAYRTIPTLETYVLVDQETIECTIFHRAHNWISGRVTSAQQELVLDTIHSKIPLTHIYESTGLLPK
jgi:Uma2 family endonuclease